MTNPRQKKSVPSGRRAKRKRGVGKMNFCPPALPAEGGMGGKRWAGFNPQNPLDFAQNGFGFHPTNTTLRKAVVAQLVEHFHGKILPII